MSFNDLNISKKLMVAFAGVVTIVLVMSVAIYLAMGSIRAATAANDESQNKLLAAGDALSAMVEQQNAVRGYVASGDETFVSTVKAKGEVFKTAFKALTTMSSGGDESARLETLRQNAETVWAEEDGQIAGRRDPASVAKVQASIATTGRLTAFRATLKSITDPETVLMKTRTAAQDKAFDSALLTLLLGGAVSLLISALMGWVLTLSLIHI